VVTVRNDRDCLQASPAITITEPDPLTAASAAANTTCSTTTFNYCKYSTGGTPSTVERVIPTVLMVYLHR
jgi:hypothetical protein